jgi:hypothetical protein
MRDINKMFSTPEVIFGNREEVEQKSISNEIATIFSKLASESKAGRNFTCNDVSQILQSYIMDEHKMTHLGQVIALLADAFSYVQGGNGIPSIAASLRNLCSLSTTTPLEKKIFEQMLSKPELYSWIKTTGI